MQQDDFLAGVVEGFYGQPWAQHQRHCLFDQLSTWGLNTYFYAPKDDLKHRAIWREGYDELELVAIRELIDGCRECQLKFIYGLSPGLDIKFDDESELDCIKRRFSQLMDCGAQHFALLFDDLPGQMTDEERQKFGSVAAAQCEVTNAIADWAQARNESSRFLFCPTPYCDRMDRAELGGAGYLDTIGRQLSPSVDILWTGPEIVPREIPVDSIVRLTERLQRPPVIWENLFANDYDLRRVYCGPYAGRTLALRQHVRGILLNPNNEFPLNFVPLRTFADYVHKRETWEPRSAFFSAVAQWLEHYPAVRQSIPLDDLILLTDCYYLPHEEGPEAIKLFHLVRRLLTNPCDSWGEDYQRFIDLNERIQAVFERLTELRDRELFQAWSRRAWELKEEFQLIDELLTRKKEGADLADGVCSEHHLPGTCRGGLVAKLQRLMPMCDEGQFRLGQEAQ